jgi:hypothetical protein
VITRFELLLSPARRRELDVLATSLDVSAADVLRLGLARMVRAHSRKAKHRAAPPMPAAVPAAPPSIATMSLDALHVLRDKLALERSPEASREYTEVHIEILKREMQRGVK